jgi:hypothetical protein
LVIDVLGQHVSPIFKGRAVQEDGTDMLSENISSQLSISHCNIPEEWQKSEISHSLVKPSDLKMWTERLTADIMRLKVTFCD